MQLHEENFEVLAQACLLKPKQIQSEIMEMQKISLPPSGTDGVEKGVSVVPCVPTKRLLTFDRSNRSARNFQDRHRHSQVIFLT